MATRKKKPEQPSFRQARERLDEILDELESDTGDIDELAARVKEAAGLIRTCREKLSSARHEVTAVVAELATEEKRTAAEASAGDSAGVAEDDDVPEPEPPPGFSDDVVEDDLPF